MPETNIARSRPAITWIVLVLLISGSLPVEAEVELNVSLIELKSDWPRDAPWPGHWVMAGERATVIARVRSTGIEQPRGLTAVFDTDAPLRDRRDDLDVLDVWGNSTAPFTIHAGSAIFTVPGTYTLRVGLEHGNGHILGQSFTVRVVSERELLERGIPIAMSDAGDRAGAAFVGHPEASARQDNGLGGTWEPDPSHQSPAETSRELGNRLPQSFESGFLPAGLALDRPILRVADSARQVQAAPRTRTEPCARCQKLKQHASTLPQRVLASRTPKDVRPGVQWHQKLTKHRRQIVIELRHPQAPARLAPVQILLGNRAARQALDAHWA
jgi:hypothetical protein